MKGGLIEVRVYIECRLREDGLYDWRQQELGLCGTAGCKNSRLDSSVNGAIETVILDRCAKQLEMPQFRRHKCDDDEREACVIMLFNPEVIRDLRFLPATQGADYERN